MQHIFHRSLFTIIASVLLPAFAAGQTPTLEELKKFPSAQKAFDARMTRAVAERDLWVQRNPDVQLIVGRVQFEGNDDPETVRSQMVVVENGFFVEVIRDPKLPIGFRHFDYKPRDFVIPEDVVPTEDGIIDVGVVKMSRASSADKGRIVGKLKLEGSDDSSAATVSLSLSNIRANTPHNGTEGVGRKYVRKTAKVDQDGAVSSEPVSEGQYYISLNSDGYVSTSRRVTVKAGEEADFGLVEMELPRRIDVAYRVLKNGEDTFADCPEMEASFAGGHRWKATPDIYGWDLDFKQAGDSIEFSYSYGPCRIKDLGPGKLEDHLDALPDAATDSPRGMEVTSGHVYLLNQQHWKHAVLFRVEIGGKVDPGQKAPTGIPVLTDSPRVPNVIAHYEFEGNAAELNGTGFPFDLKNTEFENGALSLNGQYGNSGRGAGGGFQAIANTPNQNYESFTVAVRFKAESFGARNSTILCGGRSYRWFEIGAGRGNSVGVSFNNHRVSHTFQGLTLRPGRWHRVVCAVDIPKKMVAMVLDNNRPEVFQLPADFKLDVVGSNAEERDKNWTFTNYSNANTFHGLVDELTILKGTMSADAFKETIAKLKDRPSAKK